MTLSMCNLNLTNLVFVDKSQNPCRNLSHKYYQQESEELQNNNIKLSL